MARNRPVGRERLAADHGASSQALCGGRILRLRSVLDRTGLSRSTLYRKMAEGSFPDALAISARCVGWRESEVDAWLADPIAPVVGG